jgi:hypothetical protein
VKQIPITVDQVRELLRHDDQILVSNTAKTSYQVLPRRHYGSHLMPGRWEVTCTQTALTALTDHINAARLTLSHAPPPLIAPPAHRQLIAVIESNHTGITVVTSTDPGNLVQAVLQLVLEQYGDRLNADEGSHFLAEHPYPASGDPVEASDWLAALADLVLDPLIHFFGEHDVCRV